MLLKFSFLWRGSLSRRAMARAPNSRDEKIVSSLSKCSRQLP
jgi:hypothetical protein